MTGPTVIEIPPRYGCPRCNRTFDSMEDYEHHERFCNDDVQKESEKFIGKWIRVDYTNIIGWSMTFIGKAIGVLHDSSIDAYGTLFTGGMGIEGVKLHRRFDTYPNHIQAYGSEEEARAHWETMVASVCSHDWKSMNVSILNLEGGS